MNKVDICVKGMMLQYPSIFPTRLSCLRHLFMVNGNGYQWVNGELRSSYPDTRPNDVMYYGDLERKEKPIVHDIQLFQNLRDEKERMDRKFREDNIDLLCRFGDIDDAFSYNELRMFDPDWSAFAKAEYGKIDPDWAKALEETIRCIKLAFNKLWDLQHDIPVEGRPVPEPSMFSRMPQNFQDKYNKVLEFEQKLDAQTGSKAKRQAMIDDFRKHLAETLKKG